MARQARQESSTNIYHIVMRGNNRQLIFEGRKNKSDFMKLLNKQREEKLIELIAWCIMDNHVHIVLKAELPNLMLAMKKINVSYAMRYNLKNKTVGHVFQDRFKSEAIEDDTYLIQVIRYIHNNPVKAGLIESADKYEWSSYKTYLLKEEIKNNSIMQIVMNKFDNNKEKYMEYHKSSDYNEYLDVKEDVEGHRNQKIELIIKEVSHKYGIYNGHEMLSDPKIKRELIEKMILNSGLSLRKIAGYLEVSFSVVQSFNREVKSGLDK